MQNWFEWNNVNSLDMGVIIESMPPIPRAQRNVTQVEIPGRDGILTMSNDTYAPVELPIICGLRNSDRLQELLAWLIGSGDLILSTAASKRYKARLDNSFSFERVGRRFRRFELLFSAQPFRYEAQPQTVTMTGSSMMHNPSTRWSMPIITVYGEGVLTVGDYTLTIEATSGEDSVTINSEIEECYYNGLSRNNKVSGEFPRIEPGMTSIGLGTGITKVEVRGNWRWF